MGVSRHSSQSHDSADDGLLNLLPASTLAFLQTGPSAPEPPVLLSNQLLPVTSDYQLFNLEGSKPLHADYAYFAPVVLNAPGPPAPASAAPPALALTCWPPCLCLQP